MAATKAVKKTFTSIRTINTYKRVQKFSNLISGALAGRTDSRLVSALTKIQSLEALAAKDFVVLANETEAMRSLEVATQPRLALRKLNLAVANLGVALKWRVADEIVRFDERDELAMAQSLENLFSATSLKSVAKEVEKARLLATASSENNARTKARVQRFEKQLSMKVFDLESTLISTKRLMLESGVAIPKIRGADKAKKEVNPSTPTIAATV